ncbi:RsmF rRNA methyltransferase first C-terminal domain-containing protein [Brevibacillus daliensis]|uniref:RsmF rRNA methyltransferase first C-terminal domain-containing protein n=1 Tax=Brevibacillus daliensis TaxID=2892995 RepID=UPI001E4DABDD|nr:RsmB/NOP family class I SAM-dependent RNA methyltransferase [Brevibacillus daliensis]
MNIALPETFTTRMKQMLGKEEFKAFLASYTQEPKQGLRVNLLKTTPKNFLTQSPFPLYPVPWNQSGFYYVTTDRPGKHPYHAAGLYYLQEPSAMSVAESLQVSPGERILDLCAAPGGKSTQIAAALQRQGLLIANEIHPVRVKALSENIERLGIPSTIVTNENPENLASHFPSFFDKIVVDAPCSGEGMFRKLPEAINDWSETKVFECATMQHDILDSAVTMLKEGGLIVYSTSRLWPHRLEGEGHYLAVLRHHPSLLLNREEESPKQANKKKEKPNKQASSVKEAFTFWESFVSENLLQAPDCVGGEYLLFGEQLYLQPEESLSLEGIKVARPGLHLGTVKKNRFEPSHALALALQPEDALHRCDLSSTDEQVYRYLRGETWVSNAPAGWTLVTVDGYPLGWAKSAGGQMKNHYPKGLRWL